MKFRKLSGITYLDNLHSAWHADDLCEVKDVYRLLDQFVAKNTILKNSLPVFFILDYTAQRYLLMSDRLQDISGYHPQEFLETGMEKLMDVFHKDDFRIFNDKIFALNTDFLSRTAPADHNRYVFSYNFRFMDEHKHYVNVLQRSAYITSPQTGRPLYSMGTITDISHFKTDESIVHSIEDLSLPPYQKTVERNFFYPNEQEALLTSREKMILSYIADGEGSKQIAAKLSISENTVDNHRQNMMRKTNTRNMAQLVAFAIRNRLI